MAVDACHRPPRNAHRKQTIRCREPTATRAETHGLPLLKIWWKPCEVCGMSPQMAELRCSGWAHRLWFLRCRTFTWSDPYPGILMYQSGALVINVFWHVFLTFLEKILIFYSIWEHIPIYSGIFFWHLFLAFLFCYIYSDVPFRSDIRSDILSICYFQAWCQDCVRCSINQETNRFFTEENSWIPAAEIFEHVYINSIQ